MKCKKCGIEFAEGIFCPECGTKVELVEEKNEQEKEVKEEEKRECLEKEREGVDHLEQEKSTQEIQENSTTQEGEDTSKERKHNVRNDITDTKKITNRKAITSLVLGILSWIGLLTIIVPIVGGIWSIVDGVKALKGKTKYKMCSIIGILLSVSVLGFILYSMIQSTPDNDTENATVVQDNQYTLQEDNQKEQIVSDEDLKEYEDKLNSYDTSIIIFENGTDMKKYEFDTEVIIDGERISCPTFDDSIIISTTLKEGTHEIWLKKTTGKKEKESNKIKFEVTPLYTNYLEIEAKLKNKNDFSLSISIENNEVFEGSETELYKGVEIVRTSNGKQIYYTVEFFMDNTQFINDYSITNTEWIDTVKVARGDDAVAPAVPNVENYEFVGWSEDITNIKSNLTVFAQYELREEDWFPEYLGRYRRESNNYYEGEEYFCTLEINRITNIGVYFSLNFMDKQSGEEIVLTNEVAWWYPGGTTAHWSYEEDGKEYYLVLSLNEYEDEYVVSIIDRIGNTNAENQMGDRYKIINE